MSAMRAGYNARSTVPPVVSSLSVGLVGAGPWARHVTGPIFAAGPDTQLAGVWSRTAAHAESLAASLDAPALASFDDLLAASDVVAIAVAPHAQPDLAIRAASAGKTLLLEKPLAVELDDARRIAEVVAATGVGALVTLTNRFLAEFDEFVATSTSFSATGARGCFLSGAFLDGSVYATPWRLQHGCLLDVGPHLLDLHEAALGEIVEVHAAGDRHGWVSLTLEHDSGVTSQASLCCTIGADSRTELELFGPEGSLVYDARAVDRTQLPARLRNAVIAVANGGSHPASVGRALHLQELIARAHAQLAA
jgi:predicted dehydrogenase